MWERKGVGKKKNVVFFGWKGRKNSILMAGNEFVFEPPIKHLPGGLCQESEERESLPRGEACQKPGFRNTTRLHGVVPTTVQKNRRNL